jgi:hypothetical protein
MIATLVGGVLFGLVTLYIWKNKGGSPVVGFLWGFLVGIFGLIVVLVANPSGAQKRREEEQRQRMLESIGTMGAGTETWATSHVTAAPAAGAVVADLPMRTCPSCRQQMRCDLSLCPRCTQRSEPWYQQFGFWFTRNDAGQEYWLDPARNQWFIYRRGALCPSCGQNMPPEAAVCAACGIESNRVVMGA